MFRRLKREDHDEIAFRVLMAFLLAFIPMRAYLYLEKLNVLPTPAIIVGDLHIHHFVFGITALAIAGYLSLIAPYFRRKIAWLYGIGLALAFDEFSMWLHLNDDYWTLGSITAIVLIGGVLINGIYFARLWKRIWSATRFFNPLYHVATRIDQRVKHAKIEALAHMREVLHLKENS